MASLLVSPQSDVQCPASDEGLATLVRTAAATNVGIVTVGNSTKAHHGPSAAAGCTQISTRALARITGYEPGDMVVSAQAGVRLVDLQAELSRQGQWLPMDPPYQDATVGGILATASAGPRRLGYGAPKDLLIGLRVAGRDGVITKSGGRVVKNVTGYDLHKLHVGAFGSLGIILEANFKVRPLPEVTAVLVADCADVTAAHRLLLRAWTSAMRPVALQALDATSAARLRNLAPGLPGLRALAMLGYEGSRPVFERHKAEWQALQAGGASGRDAGDAATLEGAAAMRVWQAFRDAAGASASLVTVRVGTRPQDLPDLLLAMRGAAGIDVSVGNGVARVQLDPECTHGSALGALVRTWHALASAKGGYAVVETAPQGLPGRPELPWSGTNHNLGTRLRQAWDPQGILNPGRMTT